MRDRDLIQLTTAASGKPTWVRTDIIASFTGMDWGPHAPDGSTVELMFNAPDLCVRESPDQIKDLLEKEGLLKGEGS